MRLRPHLFHLAAWEKSTLGDSSTVHASALPARGQHKIATALSSSAVALPKRSQEPHTSEEGGIKHINHLPHSENTTKAWGSKGTCPRSPIDKASTSQGPKSPPAGLSTHRDVTTQHEEPPSWFVLGESLGRSGSPEPPDTGADAPSTRARQINPCCGRGTGETRAVAPTATVGTSATCSEPAQVQMPQLGKAATTAGAEGQGGGSAKENP